MIENNKCLKFRLAFIYLVIFILFIPINIKYLSANNMNDIKKVVVEGDCVAMNENVTIEIISKDESNSYDKEKIAKIIRDNLILPSNNPYLKAQVRVFCGKNSKSTHLLVYLTRKDIYSFETIKIDLGENYNVISIKHINKANDTIN